MLSSILLQINKNIIQKYESFYGACVFIFKSNLSKKESFSQLNDVTYYFDKLLENYLVEHKANTMNNDLLITIYDTIM